MKVAIIGSRGITRVNLKDFIPEDTTEIVSGGARGVDTCARNFAKENNLILTEFLPDYEHFGRGAPLRRNIEIIDYSDLVLAFWDGESRGTKFVIENCRKRNKQVLVYTKDDIL